MYLVVSVLIFFTLVCAENIWYVKPSISILEDCPSKPCLTLNEYIQESGRYFISGSIFVFLSGSHSLETPLNITSVSNIAFIGKNDSYPNILCADRVSVNNVTDFAIERIIFILILAQQEGALSSAFIFTGCEEVTIANSLFQKKIIDTQGNAIMSTSSNITITGCLFEGNTGNNGGAIFARQNTFLSLIGSTFLKNKAKVRGGAIYAENCTISLRGDVTSNFSRNSGSIGGGAISCKACSLMISGNITFSNNSLTGERNSTTGGAIEIDGGKIIYTGYTSFSGNTAFTGGAIALNYTTTEFRKGILVFQDNKAKYVGGGMYTNFTLFRTDNEVNFTFIDNVAEGSGPSQVCGVMCLYVTITISNSSTLSTMSANLISNNGTGGGALFVEKIEGSATLYNISARGNWGGALGIISATAKLTGINSFSNNFNLKGGAITITSRSNFAFNGQNMLKFNFVNAITTHSSTVLFSGHNSIINNTGLANGGGINSTDSSLTFIGDITIVDLQVELC